MRDLTSTPSTAKTKPNQMKQIKMKRIRDILVATADFHTVWF